MRYTNLITQKIKSIGFKFNYDNSTNEDDDEDLVYEVWSKGIIELTIERSPERKLIFRLNDSDRELKIKSIDEIVQLDKILNR